MITGTLIVDSLRPGARLEVTGLRLRSIYRLAPGGSVGPQQPEVWSVVDFEADDEVVDDLTQALVSDLSAVGGWYCDFAVGGDRVVVYAGAAFRFPRGDHEGRDRARAHGLAAGVPEHQLDWPN